MVIKGKGHLLGGSGISSHQYNGVQESQPHSHQDDTWAPTKGEARCSDLDPDLDPDPTEIHAKIKCGKQDYKRESKKNKEQNNVHDNLETMVIS